MFIEWNVCLWLTSFLGCVIHFDTKPPIVVVEKNILDRIAEKKQELVQANILEHYELLVREYGEIPQKNNFLSFMFSKYRSLVLKITHYSFTSVDDLSNIATINSFIPVSSLWMKQNLQKIR